MRDRRVQLALLRGAQAAREQLDAVGRPGEDALDVARVLLGENLGRGHQRRLVAVLDGDDHGLDGDDRLAAADVALEQAVHRPVARQVVDDLLERALLRAGRREGEDRAHRLADAVGDLDDRALRLAHPLAAADAERDGEPEELLEDEPPVRRRARLVVGLDRRVVGREVRLAQRLAARDERLARDHLAGEQFRDRRAVEGAEHVVQDRAQLARAEVAELAVDGDPPRRVDRRRLGVLLLVGREDFVLRVFDLEVALVPVPLPLAVEDDARAALEDAGEVDLVPPEGAHLPLAVGRDELVHLDPPALERDDPADPHHDLDRGGLAVLEVRDARQARAVLVAHRKVVEQVLERRLARVGLGGERRGLDRQLVRRHLADARQPVEVEFDEWGVKRKHDAEHAELTEQTEIIWC